MNLRSACGSGCGGEPGDLAGQLSEEKLARAALTYLADPGDPALGALLGICEPAEVLAAIKADMLPGTGLDAATARRAGRRWSARSAAGGSGCRAAGRRGHRGRLPATASG